MWGRPAHPVAALLLVGALLLTGGALGAEPVQKGEADDGGIRVRWTYAPSGESQGSGLGTLDLDIADAASGQPLSYGDGQVFAWLQRRRGALSDAETSCPDKVKSLLTQGVGRRADIDLNEYRLVTLNSDGSVAFINPFVGLSNAKLESIVDLKAAPRGWLALPARLEAWIITDDPPRLVQLDLHARRIAAELALPGGSAPNGLAFDAAAQLLWTALPGAGRLGLVDLHRDVPELEWVAAPGLEKIVSLAAEKDANGISGILALHRNGRVVWHDGRTSPKTWQVRGTPVAAAYSALSQRIILATEEGDLLWIDPHAPTSQAARTLSLGHALGHLALFDGGRHAIVLGGDWAGVVDLASARLVAPLSGAAGADDIVFSRNFAYAPNSRAGRATLWSLADLRAGRNQPLDVMIGSPAPDARPGEAAQRTVADPGGDGLLVASPADGMIFQYSEGMMAPNGSYSNYRRAALGLMVLDLSLRQTTSGHFRAAMRHEQGGAYELILAGLGPRFNACSSVMLAPTRDHPQQVERTTRAVLLDVAAASGGSQDLRLRLDRTEEGKTWPLSGVDDLTMLVFDGHSGWQRRIRAREAAPGEYEAHVPVPGPAAYDILVSSPSADLSFVEGRLGKVTMGGQR